MTLQKQRTGRWAAAATLTIGVVLGSARPAEACGGCFGPPGPSTQVTAHRMAFVVTSKRTVLWDQFQYVGAPSSFGWVLPIRGVVDVGVSSDQLFSRLEEYTQPRINQPSPPACPPPERKCRTTCNPPYFPTADASASDAGFFEDTSRVDVWRTEVVGPYEATQLSATDASALGNWLKDHGYVLPDPILPVVDQYVKEGFGFLAIKLVPGAGIQRMVPIRVAYDGGGTPTLPLRMIAAGTGANVGIKLWVLGEGRWEAKNFPNGEIKTEDLVWDWAAMGSNFGQLESDLLSKDGRTWISEVSEDFSRKDLADGLPPGTTQGDGGTVFAKITDQTEFDTAFGTRSTIRVTRLFAQLPQSALAADLQLQASGGGTIAVSRTPTKHRNYYCPTVVQVDCPGVTPTDDDCRSPPDGAIGPWTPGPRADDSSSGSSSGAFGCSAGPLGGSSLPLLSVPALLAMGLGLARRLRRGCRR